MSKNDGVAVEAKKDIKILSDAAIAKEVKPLSSNAFVAFWQGLWRSWLGWWYGFSDRHPKGSKLIYQLVFFFVFSNGVTLWQLLVFAVLPYAFEGLNVGVWGWPNIVIPGLEELVYPANWGADGSNDALLRGLPVTYMIFGDALGVGTWIAFEIAVFTAQCINLPLQRNITFKSKGNIYVQATWYFIGWVGVSIAMGALWGIMQVFMIAWNWPSVGILLLKTVITGGVSMAVFFPIFMIIFPDLNKMAKKANAKLEKLRASGASAEAIAKAEAKALDLNEKARLNNARKAESEAKTLASAKSVAYQASIVNAGKARTAADAMTEGGEKADAAKAKAVAAEDRIGEYKEKASEAIANKDAAIEAQTLAISEVTEARKARGLEAIVA